MCVAADMRNTNVSTAYHDSLLKFSLFVSGCRGLFRRAKKNIAYYQWHELYLGTHNGSGGTQ